MQDLKSKQKVLEEIMGLMDEKEGDHLKSHPKLMAAKLEVAKPVELEVESDEKPMSLDETAKKSSEEPKDDEEMSPEMIQKILEMYQDLK